MSFNINVKSIIITVSLLCIGANITKAQDDFSDDASSAQKTISVSGVVKDASTGNPIAGANVIVEGTDLGSATDEDGNFTIEDVSAGS